MRRTMLGALAALCLGISAWAADSGVIDTALEYSPRRAGGLGDTVEQAWPALQAQTRAGVTQNDLLALLGSGLNGQDQKTKDVYGSLWCQLWDQMAGTIVAKTPAEAGVEVVTVVARASGGRLIPREVVGGLEVPLPAFGMSWGNGKVTHGLVAFRRPGTYKAFAINLKITAGKGQPSRSLRMLVWWSCGNASVTFPVTPLAKVEKVVEKVVEVKTEFLPGKERTVETVMVITVPGQERRVEVPVPTPVRCDPRVEYVDRIMSVPCAPSAQPVQRVDVTPRILEDSRNRVGGLAPVSSGFSKVTPVASWAVNASLTWWPSATTVSGGGTCPDPVVDPDPGTLPGDPPGTTDPPVDTTLPPNPGGVPPVSGGDGAVNTPGASDPHDFPPGTVVIPVPSPGSAAANAANLLP